MRAGEMRKVALTTLLSMAIAAPAAAERLSLSTSERVRSSESVGASSTSTPRR